MGKFTKPEWKKDFDKELEEVQNSNDRLRKMWQQPNGIKKSVEETRKQFDKEFGDLFKE